MLWQRVIVAFLLFSTGAVTSAVEQDANLAPFVDKEFVIVKFSPSFKEATQSAADAAARLGMRLDLRGLSPDLRTGLTLSREQCTRSESRYPCYVPRGRGDDGTYASVEWSSSYDLFAKGMYVVMIASNRFGSSETRRVLEAARRVYPDAYARRAKVYVGRMR